METFILWVGFIGAWLLFAGSIYQAALELQDEDIKLDGIREAGAKIKKPAQVSAWLWLLFPVKIYIEYRRRKQYQQQIIKLLTREDIESFASLRSKATAWWFVAFGGFCIALKETYELVDHLEWSLLVAISIIIGMFLLSVLNLIFNLKRSKGPRS